MDMTPIGFTHSNKIIHPRNPNMRRNFLLIGLVLGGLSFLSVPKRKPVLYLIGDSTVEAGSGSNGLWGWGKYLSDYFDTTRIDIRNYAQGGASARTFYTGGLWDKKINKRGLWDTVSLKLKEGDFLLIQFGLNDQGPIDDSARARGTLPGIGYDSIQIYNRVTGKQETVNSFGWYLRKYIQFAQQRGVTVFLCSSIPRNVWKDGKLLRGERGFAPAALEVAKEMGANGIDLNGSVADIYERLGQKVATETLHNGKDQTHTTVLGAQVNASVVASLLYACQTCGIRKYLRKDAVKKIDYEHWISRETNVK
jgi:lysophospholipase L1-like esterase